MAELRPQSNLERARFGTTTHELGAGLLTKVFGLLAFSMAFAVAGGVVGAKAGPGIFLPAVIAEFVLIFAVQRMREREGWNLALLYAFAFASGITLGLIVAMYIGAGAGGAVIEAAVITGGMTVGLSAYALTTQRNLAGLRPLLFMGVLGLFVAMIANIFVGGTALSMAIGWIGAFLFSVLLVVDVNRTRYTADTMGNAVVITMSVYLDIVNLFLFILRILNGRR